MSDPAYAPAPSSPPAAPATGPAAPAGGPTEAEGRTGPAVPPLVWALLGLDVLMAAMHVLCRASWAPLSGVPTWWWLWNLDKERNIPSAYSALQLALVGGLLWLLARAKYRRADRTSWVLPLAAAGGVLLALDEFASLHERFGELLDIIAVERSETELFRYTGVWMLVCAPVFVLVLIAMAYAGWRYLAGRPKVVATYVAGIAVFLVSAAGIEWLVNLPGVRFAERYRLTLFEETGEMLGVTLIVWATCRLLVSHGVTGPGQRWWAGTRGTASNVPPR